MKHIKLENNIFKLTNKTSILQVQKLQSMCLHVSYVIQEYQDVKNVALENAQILYIFLMNVQNLLTPT